MFGNVINNSLIQELIKQKVLEIAPLDKKLLQLAQYPLRPHVVHEVLSESEGKRVHDFDDKNQKFVLKPQTYYWVDILEIIKLPVGIVGRFIPSSNLIEKGLALTAGKIENPFGEKNEKVRFGIYNYLKTPTFLQFKERIAYIQFTDLRGLDNHEYKPLPYDKKIFDVRRAAAEDDGVYYEPE